MHLSLLHKPINILLSFMRRREKLHRQTHNVIKLSIRRGFTSNVQCDPIILHQVIRAGLLETWAVPLYTPPPPRPIILPEAGRICQFAQMPQLSSDFWTMPNRPHISYSNIIKKINVYSLPRCAFIISHNMMLNLCVHCLRGRLCCGSFEGVVGCYQQDHSMDGCPNWE